MTTGRSGFVSAVLAAATFSALVASEADATIVPQRGMRGVAIGMTQKQVTSRLGDPIRLRHQSGGIGPVTVFVYQGLLVSFFNGGPVSQISTSSRSERTRTGIGVGSTTAEVIAKVPHVKCLTEVGVFHCYLGRFEPGRLVTDFSIRRGRVARVTIGRVID